MSDNKIIPASPSSKQSNRLAFLGQLAGGLAHEIRNPLSTISVTLQLLKEDWAKPETVRETRAARKIDVLLRETRRLEEILNDFLRYAGGHRLNLEQRKITDLLDEVLDFIMPATRQKKITVHKSYEENLPTVRLDSNLIKQSLLNIVINAEQAMPDGGELIVKAARDGANVRIEITDTGTGMPPDVLKKAFTVYYSTKRTGTGLGLATSRRYIEEHDGTITVQSQAGKGSCFKILLPVDGPADVLRDAGAQKQEQRTT